MRALVQRTSSASVVISGNEVGKISSGLLIFLGVAPDDTPEMAELLWNKIYNLRIFDDEDHHMNLSAKDVGAEILIVSQFTLYANCRRGRRPSFTEAAAPALANELYEHFIELARKDATKVQTGQFGADMQVSLTNNGPVTIFLDTKDLLAPK